MATSKAEPPKQTAATKEAAAKAVKEAVKTDAAATPRPDSAGAASAASASGNVTRGPLSWPSLVLLIGVGAGVLGYYNYERKRRKETAKTRQQTAGKPLLGGPYTMVDQHGRPVSSEDLKGQFLLLYFGFTYCPDICPNELVKMGKVIDLLDEQKDLPPVQPVLISLDPHRDTVAQMRAYIADFHPRTLGLTGTPAQVGRAAKSFRVFFQEVDREEDDDDYVVDHSIVMYLMGPDGELIDFFPQLTEAPEMRDRIAAHMRRELGLDKWDPAGMFARVFGGRVATTTAPVAKPAPADKEDRV